MGIDVHCLNFLSFAQKQGADFSTVLTAGRQLLYLTDDELRRFFRKTGRPQFIERIAKIRGDGFCEQLLKEVWGSKEVLSVDASSFEKASLIHDMNFPLRVDKKYSLVLDAGCLEHIFNFPVAVHNIINACSEGGYILHVLPSNNWCGHGFYQFSPELFFSLYSDERGFVGTKVFMCEMNKPFIWFKIHSPRELRRRVNVINTEMTYVLVLTKKTAEARSPLSLPPQQSDYVYQWRGTEPRPGKERQCPALQAFVKRLIRLSGLSRLARVIQFAIHTIFCIFVGHRDGLRVDRAGMEKVDVRVLLAER